MSFEESKKTKTADLTEIFKKEDKQIAQKAQNFSSFQKSPWSNIKKKQKIEVIVLIIVLALTAIVLVYYFTKNNSRIEKFDLNIPAEEGEIF